MADIHSKMAKIAGEIGSINKTERNKEQGFNFRSIEQITEKARPLLAKEGISTAPRMLSLEHSEVTAKSGARGYRAVVVMEYTFTTGSDDSSIVTSMPGEAVDYGDKSTSKAVQMAYKYALTQALQIGSGDDPDSHSVDVGHSQASTRPRSGMKRTPSPSKPSESHEDAPRTNGNGESGVTVGKMRSELLVSLNGDTAKSNMIWRETIAQFGFQPNDPIPDDMKGPIGEALKARVTA